VKTIILGMDENGFVKAYPKETIQAAGSLTETVNGHTLEIVWDQTLDTARAFRDKEPIPLLQSYWFAWVASHPETELFL
jgi:hypothetical protein